MQHCVFYTPCDSPVITQVKNILTTEGLRFSPIPCDQVTHLLLGVPAFSPDGTLKGGGNLEDTLSKLSSQVTVVGGNLDTPLLQKHSILDLLKDPFYVSENADITARCALHLAASKLPVTFKDLPVLVIGWGRIGKCLARHLKALDATVTVAARKPADQAMIHALGYGVTTLQQDLSKYGVIFNTADGCAVCGLPDSALKVDLASIQGITDKDTLWARGLPGKLAPQSSGNLIARTLLRLL